MVEFYVTFVASRRVEFCQLLGAFSQLQQLDQRVQCQLERQREQQHL